MRLIKASRQAIAAAREARAAIRGGFDRPTAGMAPGMTQANMICLPRDWAFDFLLYAQRNPQSCPVLDVIEAGDYRTPLAEGADLRSDIPRYRVWEQGRLVDDVTDATALWRQHPDLVTFLIGCSFTFETPLREAGIEIRHITDGCNVPMYKTSRQCRPAGRLSGGARRAGTYWRTASARHCRSSAPRLWRCGAHRAGRDPGLLGLRRDAPGGGDALRRSLRHQPRAGAHVHYRYTRCRLAGSITCVFCPSTATVF